MNLVMVGPGALGCLLAARLHLAGRYRVRLLDHDPRRAEVLTRQGIILHDPPAAPTGPLAIPVSADPAIIGDAELVLLGVKSFALAQALVTITPWLPSSTLLIALANGIGHLESMRRLADRCRPALGISTEGATLLAPGRVRAGGRGLTRLGYVEPSPPSRLPLPAPPHEHLLQVDPGDRLRLLKTTAANFSHAGISCRVSNDIQLELWRKLLVNVGINALSVIHDCPNGRLLEIPAARRTMALAVREAATVAAAGGVVIEEDPVPMVEAVCRNTADNISSMLQDIRRRRPTEIMAINGEVVRRGEALGLAVPVNRQLLASIMRRQTA